MTINCYQLTPGGITPLRISASTLDDMTRELPQGFYTTFTTLAGGTRVLGLKSHLQRLYIPAHDLGLKPALEEAALPQRLAELVKQNLPRESRVRLILTREAGELYAGLEPFTPLPETVYTNGVHVITADLARRNPRIKDTDFIAQSLAQRQMLNRDVFEVLLTKNGAILEGMTSNFYAVRYVIARRSETTTKQSSEDEASPRRSIRNDSTLITARYGILPGVTRRIVLRLARGQGIRIEYRAPRMDETFDEAFLTSSSRGVVPVVMMDGEPVGQGRVGEVTKRLSKAYKAYLQQHAELIGA
ncbi:MAG: aminotransferase class IV [Anaerolineales bacterium]|nr:aminotransferase class IV [Anaerolineales bacterium]NUQ84924.1 aminotransferase class IV [Anaerolineales bacterium]